MRRAFLLLVMLAVLVAGFRMLSACLTVEQVIVEKDGSGRSVGCLLCLEKPEACSGLIEECKADPRCKPAFACIEMP